MPLYEFTCSVCGARCEAIQPYDAPAPPCPDCGGETKRAVSRCSFALKGDGWAKDDYGIKAPKPLKMEK